MSNNPQHIIAALNVENRALRQQIASLAETRQTRVLMEKLVCAALTGACARLNSPTEAAEFAAKSSDAVIAYFQKIQQESEAAPTA